MTWSNRLRMFFGTLAVFAIVAACTLIFTQREGQVASRTASFKAIDYTVGSDYAGTVTEEFVKEGQKVAKGAKLISVQSASLLNAIKQPGGVPESTSYIVADNGTLTLIATEPGIVSKIETQVGSFVGAGQGLATVERDGSLFVVADYVVDAHDFTRLTSGAHVDVVLPNHDRLAGTTSKMTVNTVDGKAHVKLEISGTKFYQGSHAGLVSSGTPITAILKLREEGPLAGIRDSLFQLLEQVGI